MRSAARPATFPIGLPAILVAASVAACGEQTWGPCRVDADCATNVCLPSGACADSADAGVITDGGDAGAIRTDAGSADAGTTDAGDVDGGTPVDAGSPSICSPNKDGVITRDEVTLKSGLHATFSVAVEATVPAGSGTTGFTLDLTAAIAGQQSVRVDLEPLTGKWFAGDFPGATYVARLSQSSDLLGIFEAKADGLYLNGVASPTKVAFGETNLTYSPPVKVLKFPLRRGDTWSTEATVSGTAKGFITGYNESYTSTADTTGVVKTPFGTFDVVRVHTKLDRTFGFVVTTTRTNLFVAECFGTVAAMTSKDGETKTDFTAVAEVRRLAP